jgi:hypothetical protein
MTTHVKEKHAIRAAARLISTLLAVVPLGLWPSAAAAQTGSFPEGRYTVTRVVDGDTLWVQGLNRSIRFAGVNAPEVQDDCGSAATELIKTYAQAGSTITIEPAEFEPIAPRWSSLEGVAFDSPRVVLGAMRLGSQGAGLVTSAWGYTERTRSTNTCTGWSAGGTSSRETTARTSGAYRLNRSALDMRQDYRPGDFPFGPRDRAS